MVTEFTMPKLGHLMEEGTIAFWHKDVGARVEKGETLLEVETDKAIIAVEAMDDAVLLEILVDSGETVPVGTPIALLGKMEDMA